jgi:hypothetical protein
MKVYFRACKIGSRLGGVKSPVVLAFAREGTKNYSYQLAAQRGSSISTIPHRAGVIGTSGLHRPR